MIELIPDSRNNWRGTKHGDEFETFLPMGGKDSKASKTGADAIFTLYSLGVKTNRDETVYDFNHDQLSTRIQQFIESYNGEVDRYKRAGQPANIDNFVRYDLLKWDGSLKDRLSSLRYGQFDLTLARESLYRPFTKRQLYFDWLFINRVYQQQHIFPTPNTEQENRTVCLSAIGSNKPFHCLITDAVPDLHLTGDSQCFPFYTYDPDGSNRRENVTDWALAQFRTHYGADSISKWDIFYYVYGVLHHPGYREKFADNLKRELPRIPFAPTTNSPSGSPRPEGEGLGVRVSSPFRAFAQAGHQLADLHLNYETVTPYNLKKIISKDMPLSYVVEKMRLNKEKTALKVNESLTLADIPPEAFEYRLGNRSALEWVIDQYQVSEYKRSGIKSDPNRQDDERYIVDLVGRVITVSVETVKIVVGLPEQYSDEVE